jgi:hypothetical protein
VSAAQARLERMLAWASAYISFRAPAFPDGLPIFPVDAGTRRPLTVHGAYDATSDFAVISAKLRNCPTADLALHVPASALVVDLDVKGNKRGLADFERFDGRDPTAVETPQASSPSGGLHLIFSASQPYPNAVAIKGTGVDLRWRGGYVVLPGDGNGVETSIKRGMQLGRLQP